MTLQFAAITGFFGQLKDRFKFYREVKTLEEKLSLISQVEGNQGVELIYPYDFKDKQQTKTQLEKNGLIGAAVNVDIKGEMIWNQRSLTAFSAETRKKAFDYIAQGAEMSRFLDANLVTVCPLQDGYDYHFEVDYERSWQYLIDGFKEIAQSYPDVKISIEYKFQEPLSHYLVSTAFNALYVCLKANVPNLGVTLDFGHALQAGENPAETMTILARENKLFHIHINDNDGKWDWDLISGSKNLLSYLEFLYMMKKIDYQGWMALDVTPRHRNPIEIFSTSIHITKKLAKLAEKIDEFPIQESIAKDSPQQIIKKIYDELIK